jgi:uncharacterized protein YcsI (UPF0317 family)
LTNQGVDKILIVEGFLHHRRRERMLSADKAAQLTPAELRVAIREGKWSGPTSGLALRFVQANLVVVPAADATEFRLFCEQNPAPCPVLAELPPGDPRVPTSLAKDADIRTDIPRYRLYQDGKLSAELDDLCELWRNDLVAFLLGCSFSFDGALLVEGVPVRHVEQGRNVSMFRTARSCVPVGRFSGPLVVTYRPMPRSWVPRAEEISAAYPLLHGAPVHIGDPSVLGISDLKQPDWGDPVEAAPGDSPMFWACGVTPQAVALESGIDLMITHAPGHMFVTDMPIAELRDKMTVEEEQRAQ